MGCSIFWGNLFLITCASGEIRYPRPPPIDGEGSGVVGFA